MGLLCNSYTFAFSMQSRKTKYGVIIIGFIVALAAMLSQPYALCLGAEKQAADTAQHEDEPGNPVNDTLHLSISCTSLPSYVTLKINQEAFFLFEILFEEDVNETHPADIVHPLSHFLSRIFGVFIAPNAP